MRPAVRKLVVVLLLIFGVQLWLTAGRGIWVRNFRLWEWNPQLHLLLLAVVLALIPPVNRAIYAFLDMIRAPSPRARGIAALVVGVVAAAYLLLTAAAQDRLRLTWHDEFMYMIQAHILAHGRLWMPPHPLV